LVLGVLAVQISSRQHAHATTTPPCRRSTQFPDGLPGRSLSKRDRDIVRKANIVTEHTFKLAERACARGIRVSIENPVASYMWKSKHAASVCDKFHKVTVDYCMFGEPWRKRTSIYCGPDDFLRDLHRLCDRGHEHVRLSGWREFPGQEMVPTGKGSAAYGPALCSAWAECLDRVL
jgi:hypothetical protein